ncbi:TPA: pyruvate, water dikinase regulatory protein [Neisseria meningitidis]|uniref:posphoenolpyruvate synthetase regulatory kinase/phosphorylase PpsR n=1 Tax=Neisseria meningitidis TaxID=487 RepID=UPI000766675E|nr:pyruvate, water dikinase regulatory protein [Neisseria meningitidis]MCL6011743.1 kinase/pyrophosphorylase [Neisseria meningitidis]CWP78565.1 Putative phosphotransferase ydiA [Neisseria meningitidis]CWQ02847.1 Putative phosphotransferase ydiA [Neisseria meningitidis]CWQ10726.1 Putative phosphotransferase ydiA [Neisseria meningitidis]CWT75583.1 Putative phosphotransferase ydiA [Neisseria meningitidis]
MGSPRQVFYISDRTGLTAENIGEALLNQFGNVAFKRHMHPFVDTPDKAREVVEKVNRSRQENGQRPIAFVSVVNDEIREIIKQADAFHINFFETFLGLLEKELNTEAVAATQGHHSIGNTQRYDARMEAVNFSLNHDDGVSDKNLQEADVILMGVSRSGKTPTCLYLALQYGIRAANYPLIPDDLESTDLPRMVKPYRDKLFGLTIQPERLQAIRQERRPNSAYARIDTCRSEVADAQNMFRRHGIPFANTTDKSVEELAVHILQACKLKRRF